MGATSRRQRRAVQSNRTDGPAMSDLIAVSGVERTHPASPTSSQAVVSDLEVDNLQDRVRTLIGSGWVERLVLRNERRPEVLRGALEAARLAGRSVEFVVSSRISDLPPPLD